MQVDVRNFRGCQFASITIERILLLAGTNHEGKSSVAQAVAAALSGNPVPYFKAGSNPGKPTTLIGKGEAGALVRTGADKGSVEIQNGEAKIRVSWPKAEVTVEGDGSLYASPVATGLINILDMAEKDKAEYLIGLLKATPTKEDVARALADFDISGQPVANLWKGLETEGWDSIAKKLKENGVKLKGQWEQVTNERYGAAKAPSWIPKEGYDPTLLSLSKDGLEASLADQRQALERAIAQEAVMDADAAALKESAARLPALSAAYSRMSETAGILRNQTREAQKKVAELSAQEKEEADLPNVMDCPHCSRSVALIRHGGAWTLAKPKAGKAPAPEQDEAKKSLLRDAKAVVAKVESDLRETEQELAGLKAEQQAAVGAGIKLKKIKETQQAPEASGSVDEAREAVRVAELRLSAFMAKTEADRIHQGIERNQYFLDVVGPEGARKPKLGTILGQFNAYLQKLCGAATFDTITLDADIEFRYGGRPYILLASSEQYRVKAVLQVAVASLDGSKLLIFDGADILDRVGRNGLLTLLSQIDSPSLVAMTLSDQAEMPDLKRAGIGSSVWISQGTAQIRPKP